MTLTFNLICFVMSFFSPCYWCIIENDNVHSKGNISLYSDKNVDVEAYVCKVDVCVCVCVCECECDGGGQQPSIRLQ